MSKICINNEGLEKYLTIGKSYTILMKSETLYEILNDLGVRMFIGTERFQ